MKSLIVLISNPAALRSSRSKIDQALALLKNHGYDAELLLTAKSGHASELARNAAGKNPFRIIAAGGDGTINEVINGIAGSPVPLAVLPFGTTNVLAKELHIPVNISQAVETALFCKPQPISLGKIHFQKEGATLSRYFCLMAGIGFDAAAVRDINPGLKRLSGELAYIISGFNKLFHYAPDSLSLAIDGRFFSSSSAIISNVSRYGGHFMIAPEARITAPSLYACLFTAQKRTDLLRHVWQVIRGNHLHDTGITCLQAQNIQVNGRASIQIDGDYAGETPATITVVPDILQLVF